MKNVDEQALAKAELANKDVPVQRVAVKDNQITEEIIEDSVDELNPDDGTKDRG